MARYVMMKLSLALIPLASPALAGEKGPQAFFALEDGFVSIRVTRNDGEPLPCKVLAVTPSGHIWAEGETTDDGHCQFPKPNCPNFRVYFDYRAEWSPPVLVTFVDEGNALVPLVAPLTPGPCCLATAKPKETTITDKKNASIWPIIECMAYFLVFIGLYVLMLRRSKLAKNQLPWRTKR